MASDKRNGTVSPAGHAGETGVAGPTAGASGAPAAASPALKQDSAPARRSVAPRVALFAGVALLWLVFDQVTKAQFADAALGQLIAGPFAGIFQFRLVHNTGMAWGMLGDSTLFLGIFSLVVCAAVLVVFFMSARSASAALTLGLALVFAGGVGNAIDRLTLGYVVDFIEPVFIDFPVFNVADIGVTCGVVIVLIALLVHERQGRA